MGLSEIKIFVDGEAVAARPEQNLLQACLGAGKDVPYFCWHPSLGAVGSCRQCAVKLFNGPGGAQGQIVMACMTAPKPGMQVSIADDEASAFREAVVELVLTSHPHDCPVCEVGGDCHLQDMTVLTGHHARRAGAPKRTHLNQNLGPFIKHEMNRCIGCYRCVRFYRDYAGGEDFGVFGTARNVYFGRAADGALESDFAGNLVEVCPTGVFVDKPFSAKFRRKWDMRATPSICPHCSVGCNITLQERGGVFRRTVNRFNASLNGHFLCDRGRFGTGFLESPARLRASRNRAGALSHAAARAALAAVLREGPLIGIGSPRASIEANFALRALVGPENFYTGLGAHGTAMLAAVAEILPLVPLATVQAVERADAVLVLGDDPALAAPRLALALRQAAARPSAEILAARQIPAWHDRAARTASPGGTTPFIVATPAPTWLDALATRLHRADPARLVQEAATLAPELAAAQNPVVVAGGSPALLLAGANIALALRRAGVAASLSPLLPHANSAGLALMANRTLPANLVEGQQVIILEDDVPGAGALFARAKSVTVLDHIETATTQTADLAIAVGSFGDVDGTYVNLEGRAQRFYKAIFGPDDPPAAWRLLRDAGVEAGRLSAEAWADHAALLEDLAREIPALSACREACPPMNGPKPPTLPHRASGRTAMHAHVDVREPAPPRHADSPLGMTMEGAFGVASPVLWSPGWNSGQVINRIPPQGERGVFLFPHPPAHAPDIAISAEAEAYEAATGCEAQSDLAPAIIARRSL